MTTGRLFISFPVRGMPCLILGILLAAPWKGHPEEAQQETPSLEARLQRLEKIVQTMEENQKRLDKIAEQMFLGNANKPTQAGPLPSPGTTQGNPAIVRRRKMPLPAAKDVSREFGGHRYRFVATPKNWSEAEAFAKQEGGHLAVITGKEEQAFMESLLREAAGGTIPPTWMGLLKKNDSDWEWVNGEPTSFLFWREGEPNNARGTQDRAHLGFLGDGRWNDNQGDSPMYFVIEFSDIQK